MMKMRYATLALGLVLAASVSAQTPARVEYFLDTDPGYGAAVQLSNVHVGDNELTFDLSSAKEGAHVLYVRAQDSEGHWSTTMSRPIFIERYQDIVYVEYFFDTDPGVGMATPAPLPKQDYMGQLDFPLELNIDHLELGEHWLYVRARDRYDQWTDVLGRSFTIIENQNIPVEPVEVGDLSRIEYFFDTDPGYGHGRALANANTGTNTYVMDFSGLEAGAHILYIRAQDTNYYWSATVSRPMYVINSENAKVTAVEYFIDNDDPGAGSATPVVVPAETSGSFVFEISTDNLAIGDHQLNVRVRDEDGKWSVVSSQPFKVVNTDDAITSIEWLMPIGLSLNNGVLTLRDDSSSPATDRTVEVFNVAGMRVGIEHWPAGQRQLSMTVSVPSSSVLIVRVTDGTHQFMQRILNR